MVLLPVDTATRLAEDLRQALSSPESIALASWPREVCSFPVSPQTRGLEEYLSFHLDSGPQPYSTWQLRGQALVKVLHFVFWSIGVVSLIRWLLHVAGG